MFCLTRFHMIRLVSHRLLSSFRLPFHYGARESSGPCHSFIGRVAIEFHTIFHVLYLFFFLQKCVCPAGQSPGVTADISSERALLLVLNPPLRPSLHKTMVSIASTEYIHSSERGETGWLGLLASLPTVTPGSQGNLFIFRGSFKPGPTSPDTCTNNISVLGSPVHALPPRKLVYLFSWRETREQTDGFGPAPAFLMNGLYFVFLRFPRDTAISFDR